VFTRRLLREHLTQPIRQGLRGSNISRAIESIDPLFAHETQIPMNYYCIIVKNKLTVSVLTMLTTNSDSCFIHWFRANRKKISYRKEYFLIDIICREFATQYSSYRLNASPFGDRCSLHFRCLESYDWRLRQHALLVLRSEHATPAGKQDAASGVACN
jgi:hypothetical protein